MQKVRCVVFAVVVLALIALPIQNLAQAQTNAPFLTFLSAVPDTDAVRKVPISFADYQAIMAARPGATIAKSGAEWLKLLLSQDLGATLAMAALRGVFDLSGIPTYFLDLLKGMSATVGIDFLSIGAVGYFGSPPAQGRVLLGTFDVAAIRSAFLARGFTETQIAGITGFCGPDGCDAGQKINPKKVDKTNPFGGELGRQEPIAATDSVIYSSPTLQTIQDMVGASQGKIPSLAKAADVAALAAVLTQTDGNARLLQALILPEAYLKPSLVLDKLPKAMQALIKAMLSKGFSPLPAYNLVAFAHKVDDKGQLVLITLVYDKADDAKTAATVLADRLTKYTSIVSRSSFLNMLKDRNAELGDPQVVSSGEKSIVVLPIRSPIEAQDPKFTSGLVYSILTKAALQLDLLWLAEKLE